MHKKQKWKLTSREPKTLVPVVVLTKPTSRRALNGHLPSPSSTLKSSPVAVSLPGESLIKLKLLQVMSSQQKTCAVSSSIIGETTLQATAWKLMGIGSS